MKKVPQWKSAASYAVFVFATCIMPLTAFTAPILFEWSDAVSSDSPPLPPEVNDDDPFTFSIIVDNGGTGTISQTWTGTDFVSASIDVNSGVYTGVITGTGPGFYASSESFATDEMGNVISAPFFWEQGFPGHVLTDNVAGSSDGVWFINGSHGIWADSPVTYGLDALDVGNNTNPASWSVSSISIVPAPTTPLLMGAGLVGLWFARPRK